MTLVNTQCNQIGILLLFFTFQNFRMITTTEDHATGAVFRQAAPNTAFGKVFSNNMDNESFVGEPSTGLSLILNNSKTATYQFQGDAMTSPELNNCLVS